MLKDLTKKMQEKLREHAKLHTGGMKSKHMKNMIKNISNGDTFSVAHNKAKKLDKKVKTKTKTY
mgnify:CR=1 FL=1